MSKEALRYEAWVKPIIGFEVEAAYDLHVVAQSKELLTLMNKIFNTLIMGPYGTTYSKSLKSCKKVFNYRFNQNKPSGA